MKIRVGIFFGGTSRVKERSFDVGRTAYNYLNRSCFEPVPIFVDSLENIILLNWQSVYQPNIRDFCPAPELCPPSIHQFRVYIESLGNLPPEELNRHFQKMGKAIKASELPELINFAFVVMPGEFGALQMRLEELRIPYTGSNSTLCGKLTDQTQVVALLKEKGFNTLRQLTLSRQDWLGGDANEFLTRVHNQVGFPVNIRSTAQSAIEHQIEVRANDNADSFREAVDGIFGREIIRVGDWLSHSEYDRVDHIRLLINANDGLGFPIKVAANGQQYSIFHPDELLKSMNRLASEILEENAFMVLEGGQSTPNISILENPTWPKFSCLVLAKEDGSPVTLLPEPDDEQNVAPQPFTQVQSASIRKVCEQLFSSLGLQAYAGIRGYIDEQATVYIDQVLPNPEPYLPTQILHAGAAIGLSPSQLLTYMVRSSLQARANEHPEDASYRSLLSYLDNLVRNWRPVEEKKVKVGLFYGGYGIERNLTLQTARHVYEVLSGSEEYDPIPVLLTGTAQQWEYYQTPGAMLFLPDVDSIVKALQKAPAAMEEVETLRNRSADILVKYASGNANAIAQKRSLDDLTRMMDQAFIALQGRPGEDGQLQHELDIHKIPYNGSGPKTSHIAVNKVQTLDVWRRNGFLGPNQLVVSKRAYDLSAEEAYQKIESRLSYPFVAKPIDQNGGIAVKVIRNRTDLDAYLRMMFRPVGADGAEYRKILKLKPKAEFPFAEEALLESLIGPEGARHFMEITATVLASPTMEGSMKYQIFDLAEVLPGKPLSAIPAQFSRNPQEQTFLTSQVKADFEKAIRILDIMGLATIDGFVRIYENANPEIILLEANTLPPLHYGRGVMQQSGFMGITPYAQLDQLLSESRLYAELMPKLLAEVVTAPKVTIPIASIPTDPVDAPVVVAPTVVIPETGKSVLPEIPSYGVEARFKEFLNDTIGFFVSQLFIKNLLAIGAFLFLTFFAITTGMKLYTHHGESLELRDFRGMSLEEAKAKARAASFRIVVNSTQFDPDKAPGIILDQDPKPPARVKNSRNIYVEITSGTAPPVDLPDLVGRDEVSVYIKALNRKGLKVAKIEYQFDRILEENTVMFLKYNGRTISDAELKRGVKVPKASKITLVVSVRNTGDVPIPDVLCKSFDQAEFIVGNSGVKLILETDDNNPASRPVGYFVWKQEPVFYPDSTMKSGGELKLYLTRKRPADCPTENPVPESEFENQ
ncbi:PASTA domain-containing protein [Haliscomenobacter sp.]|uniref:PASTA domain-containing protein n=1 Tax=Haliscomenobacter sp. TaxID=2717303 RepID=UPI0033652E95